MYCLRVRAPPRRRGTLRGSLRVDTRRPCRTTVVTTTDGSERRAWHGRAGAPERRLRSVPRVPRGWFRREAWRDRTIDGDAAPMRRRMRVTRALCSRSVWRGCCATRTPGRSCMRHCKLRACRARVRRSRWLAAGGGGASTTLVQKTAPLARVLVHCRQLLRRRWHLHLLGAALARFTRRTRRHARRGAARGGGRPARAAAAATPQCRRTAVAAPRAAASARSRWCGRRQHCDHTVSHGVVGVHAALLGERRCVCAHARSHAQPFFGVVFAAFSATQRR